jgi:HEAT repeat protein
MADKMDVAHFQQELTDAFHWGDEERAHTLVSQMAVQPRKARAVLEEMLESPDGPVRQAAAFGLGVLGGGRQREALGTAARN